MIEFLTHSSICEVDYIVCLSTVFRALPAVLLHHPPGTGPLLLFLHLRGTGSSRL